MDALGRELLERVSLAGGGHTADTAWGGHEPVLRQTVIALMRGPKLAEHENPGEATVHVQRGRVQLVCGEQSWEGRAGDLIVVPMHVTACMRWRTRLCCLTVAKLP